MAAPAATVFPLAVAEVGHGLEAEDHGDLAGEVDVALERGVVVGAFFDAVADEDEFAGGVGVAGEADGVELLADGRGEAIVAGLEDGDGLGGLARAANGEGLEVAVAFFRVVGGVVVDGDVGEGRLEAHPGEVPLDVLGGDFLATRVGGPAFHEGVGEGHEVLHVGEHVRVQLGEGVADDVLAGSGKLRDALTLGFGGDGGRRGPGQDGREGEGEQGTGAPGGA